MRLLPRGSGDLRTPHGAGYATMFLLNAAAMGLPVYGPAILQTLRGLSALLAGYVVGAEALFWTAASLPVAGLTGRWPGRLIRLGVVTVFAGLALCALVFDDSHLVWVVIACGVVGAGSGLSWAFISQRILGELDGRRAGDRRRGHRHGAADRRRGRFGHGRRDRQPGGVRRRLLGARGTRRRPASGCSSPRCRSPGSPASPPGGWARAK